MEPLTIFASSVGFICALHLLSTVAERLGKGKYNRGNQHARREDWYCFFQLSDLLGTDTTRRTDTPQPTITDADRLDQRRRQQASRPRLQV